MAQWQVLRSRIELFEHPNADSLQLGKVGPFQVVIQKGIYEEGDEVVFAPEKSVLPDGIAEPYKNYLRGKESNRVGSVRLRGQLSMGILIPVEKAVEFAGRDLPHDECLSDLLGITKYEPPIPQSLSGEVEAAPEGMLSQHDVEQFGIYANEFKPEDQVVVTEKLHGSQVMFYLTADGDFGLSSKGILGRGLVILESESNTYWRAARNCGIETLMREFANSFGEPKMIQVFGEVIPVQGGNWMYGIDSSNPEVRLFDIRSEGVSIDRSLTQAFNELWVPVVADGIFSDMDFDELCKGKERVSGYEIHIREGIVIRPSPDRRAADGTRLMLKVINPKYAKKETGEEVS